MRPSIALQTHRTTIRRIVAANRATNAHAFGSVAAGRDSEGSDLDILVDPEPGTTLFDIGMIQSELRELLGVRVDILTPAALPAAIRAAVLNAAMPV